MLVGQAGTGRGGQLPEDEATTRTTGAGLVHGPIRQCREACGEVRPSGKRGCPRGVCPPRRRPHTRTDLVSLGGNIMSRRPDQFRGSLLRFPPGPVPPKFISASPPSLEAGPDPPPGGSLLRAQDNGFFRSELTGIFFFFKFSVYRNISTGRKRRNRGNLVCWLRLRQQAGL